MLFGDKKKGQLTVFIIVGIVIIVGIIGYFLLKNETIGIGGIPKEFKPVEEYFLSCIEEHAKAGISIIEERGGYIYLPEFEQGSEYMPSSSQLDFLGTAIPYWYYISGNNIIKEQIPDKTEIKNQLEKYLNENLFCDFSSFEEQGFVINLGKIKTDVSISENKVDVSINADLEASFGDNNFAISSHKSSIESKLGKFYDLAGKIYTKENEEMFLENYGLDVLYLYAPVNDAELSCSPKIWLLDKIKEELKNALEANTLALKVKGDYYKNADKYFIVDISGLGKDEAVQFLYSKNWPTKIEVNPNNNGVLIAEPVGNQPGLGILGFCYITYHFVYDVTYPVLIRIYDDSELFQFPVVVLVQGNKPREALPGSFIGEIEPEICKYKNTKIGVYTYNNNLEPVEADISFKCFNQECDIGETKLKGGDAVLSAEMPQCVNGFVIAEAEGYELKKQQVSTNLEGVVNLILDKLYDTSLNLKLDGKESGDTAVIYFESEDTSATIALPEQKNVKLSEGLYNISVFVYKNSSITIPETKTQKCVNVPEPGLMGFFGSTTEKCFEMTIPSQQISNVLIGGGKIQQYITETELEKGKAEISIISLPLPKSIEDLQKNYDSIETKTFNLEFK